MENIKFKPISAYIFFPLLFLIFIRPFVSGLAYPVFEFYYEILVIFLATIFFSTRFVCSKNIVRARPQAESRTNPYIPILLLLSACIVSTITSVNLHNSIKETLKFISYISIFFCVSSANEVQKKTIIKAMLISAILISLYAIYQYFWGYQHTIDFLKSTNNALLLNSSYVRDILLAKRAIATFPSPNIFGSYLIMMVFLSLTCIPPRRWGFGSTLLTIPRIIPSLSRENPTYAVGVVIALILTKSLGAWLSIIVCLIILFFISYNTLRNKKIILITSGLCIAFILLFITLNRWERLMNLDNPQNSITQRINYWRTAIAVIKDHPILGVGPGNFQEVFLKYKVGLSTNTRYAHNIFLHMWAETGILGFTGIFFFIFSLLQKGFQNNKQKLIFLAITVFVLHNLIDNSFFIPETGLLWWAIIGLAF